MNAEDRINQHTWTGPWAVQWFAALQGFIDAGERAAYWSLVDEVRDQPILDLGVGGGRSIALLRPLTRRYVAIDYLPVMVESVRRTFPFVDVRLGDARDLSEFADASFHLVAFSNRGIDSVDHESRRRVIAEVHRVVKPGGIFWFSTLNKDGEVPRRRPWLPRWPQRGVGSARYAAELLQMLKRIPRQTLNYRRICQFAREGEGWSSAPFYPHDFGLIAHYTTLQNQLDELAHAGFRPGVEVYDDQSGERVDVACRIAGVPSFTILARK